MSTTTENELTINDYVTLETYKYPSLYAGLTLEKSKLRILDHLLTTLGNGIYFTDVINQSYKNPTNMDILSKDNSHLFDGTEFFYLYKSANSREKIIHPHTRKEVMALTLKEIQELGWDNDDYYRISTVSDSEKVWTPYPGFYKEYSFVWEYKDHLHKLPVSILEGFLWYYDYVLNFFKSDDRYFYSYSCPNPNDTQAWEKYMKEWQETYDGKTKEILVEEDKMPIFSKSYGVKYDGNDLTVFLEKLQENLMNQNIQFIEETVQIIQNVISQKQS